VCAQGYTGAFIVTSKDNRPSGQGYVTFDSNAAQLAAFEVRSKGKQLWWSLRAVWLIHACREFKKGGGRATWPNMTQHWQPGCPNYQGPKFDSARHQHAMLI
jgi:hypothetical protein